MAEHLSRVVNEATEATNGDGVLRVVSLPVAGALGLSFLIGCAAQAIEARRAETHSGSVHESAVPQAGAQC